MATIRCNETTFRDIQAVIFDKDGTLADSAAFLKSLGHKRSRLIDAQIPGVQEPLLMAFGLEATQINPAGLLAVGTRRENEIAAAAYVAETGKNWLESLKLVQSAFTEADTYMQRKADHTPLFKGSTDLLLQLVQANIKLGLLSSDTTNHVEDFVQRYELEPYFQLYRGTDAGPSKPDPTLLQEACQTLKVAPQHTLVIGDSQVDIHFAHAAEAAGCIGVTWGWTNGANLSAADAVVSDFAAIQVLAADD